LDSSSRGGPADYNISLGDNNTVTVQLTWKDLEAEDVLLSDEVRILIIIFS